MTIKKFQGDYTEETWEFDVYDDVQITGDVIVFAMDIIHRGTLTVGGNLVITDGSLDVDQLICLGDTILVDGGFRCQKLVFSGHIDAGTYPDDIDDPYYKIGGTD